MHEPQAIEAKDQLGRCRSDCHGYLDGPRTDGPKRVGRGAELASRSEPESRTIEGTLTEYIVFSGASGLVLCGSYPSPP
jgi:hypothetical protein